MMAISKSLIESLAPLLCLRIFQLPHVSVTLLAGIVERFPAIQELALVEAYPVPQEFLEAEVPRAIASLTVCKRLEIGFANYGGRVLHGTPRALAGAPCAVHW